MQSLPSAAILEDGLLWPGPCLHTITTQPIQYSNEHCSQHVESHLISFTVLETEPLSPQASTWSLSYIPSSLPNVELGTDWAHISIFSTGLVDTRWCVQGLPLNSGTKWVWNLTYLKESKLLLFKRQFLHSKNFYLSIFFYFIIFINILYIICIV